jgi:L-serine dehydratase
MTGESYPELFNDVFGPVMQPGSSSHTAAPCRLGFLAADLLGEPVRSAHIVLKEHGSFAGTFGIMAEDRAMAAGVLGLLPDDERLFRAFELAEERGATVAFEFAELPECEHPNAMKFILTGESGRTATLVGTSTGGGMIETVSVDGLSLEVKGDTFVLLVVEGSDEVAGAREEASPAADGSDDADGADAAASESDSGGAAEAADVPDVTPTQLRMLTAGLAGVVEERTVFGLSGAMRVARLARPPDLEAVQAAAAAVSPRLRVSLLRPVLPVITQPQRRPQLFETMTRWRELAAERGLALSEVAVQYEMDASGWSREHVVKYMRGLAALMQRQTRAAYEDDVTVPTGPFKPDFTGRWVEHLSSPVKVTDGVTAATIKWAYGAGAGIPGVRTVPGPMGGGGGYVHAALSAVREARGLSDDDLLRGLFVAGGVGAVAFSRTEPTGEVLGCSGEAGVCGAMAAAGIVEMVGGDPQAAEDAASLALQAFTGMPCDPMPGGLCQPCRSRVIAATCMAHVFADLAMAGHAAVLPLHEAIDVADAVGRALPPDLLCTSEGGACAAPAAQACRDAYRRWFKETPPHERPPGNLI